MNDTAAARSPTPPARRPIPKSPSSRTDKKTKTTSPLPEKEAIRAGVSLSLDETVARYGSATAEFQKGFSGVDNATGQRFSKGLADVAKQKVSADPLEAAKNLKQQAGISAEIAATSRDNAQAIIDGSQQRTVRTDDLPQLGKNHPVIDRVQVLDGQIIEGTQAQMKFVGDRDTLLSRIASEDGKFARYRGVKLELPSEQYHDAKVYCEGQAETLRGNAQRAEQAGKPDVAAKLRREAANYEELAGNVRDSGLTTDEALFYRTNPGLATLRDIAKTSHRAGLEGAKYGAVIGGSVFALKQALQVAQGKAQLKDAAKEVSKDVVKSAALGYATAAAGAAIKGGLEQSSREGLRVLANTSAPTLAVNICLSLGGSIHSYVRGDITEEQLAIEVGEKSLGMLSSGMFAALGQVVVPIPFVGAALGGMVGYTLSSMFYACAVDASKAAGLSREQLKRVTAIEESARASIAQEQKFLDELIATELPRIKRETDALFAALSGQPDVDAVATSVNRFAATLGTELQFSSQAEFDVFMASEQSLRL